MGDEDDKMLDESTPGAISTSTASPLVVRDGKVEAIVAKELSFSPASSSSKSSPAWPAGRLLATPVAPEAPIAAHEAAGDN
eukprot:SAG11_NODE_10329_length_839_cov_1.097297_1_plen_81_part_00